jgi:hypothetical protein
MNSQECIEKIEENYSERRRKFSSLLSGKEQNLLQGEIIIVFLYAHFEGFITDATSLYIQLANKELSSWIVKLEEKIVFKQMKFGKQSLQFYD